MRRVVCLACLLCLAWMVPLAAEPPQGGSSSGGDKPPAQEKRGEKDGGGSKAGEKGGKSKSGGKKRGAANGPSAGEKKSGDRSSAGHRSRSRSRKPARNLALAALRTTIDDATFEDTTFEEFVEWLQRTCKANIVVRWTVLENEGVERDCPIEIKRKNISLKDLLPLVFQQVTDGLPDVELAARTDGNTLMITTRQDIQTKNIVRVYDVQDLLAVAPNFRGMEVDMSGGARARFRDSTGRNGGEIGPSAEREAGQKLDPVVKKLIDAITTHIQPLSWKVNGGKGTIRYFKGRLVVNNNVEVHQLLGGMIKDTRN